MTDSDEFQDPYIDPGTRLLRNLVGASTKAELENAEADLSFSRLIQLMDRPPNATGDLAELCAIHRHLFQDIYEWAGQIRTVDVRKNVPGAEFFLPVAMITRASAFAADDLRSDRMLHGMNRLQFIDRLSHHYEQFNYIDPFREGKGGHSGSERNEEWHAAERALMSFERGPSAQ